MSRQTVIQRHHIRYPGHPLGEKTVELTMFEHTIISKIQRLSRVSPGFYLALVALLEGMFDRILVIGERQPKDWPGRILLDSGWTKEKQ